MRIRYRELECFKKVEKGWINSIPDIWNCANLGYFCEFIMGQAPHSDTYNTIGEGTIFIKAGDFGKKYPKVTNYTINPLVQCKKGDILICVVGATSGKINFAIDGSISRSVAALRVKKELDKRYLYYFLDYSYQNINDLANGSAQGIINKDILKNIVIPLPNKETQQKISNFLDKKTAQFDSIISKKEALIEKLEEAKKSLISEVVTGKVKVVKSSDDGYELVERKKEEMKDCGVEWLGEIPNGWEFKSIKYSMDVLNGKEIEDEHLNIDKLIAVFGSGGIFKYTSEVLYNEPSVLFGRKGTIGKPIYVEEPFWTVDTMYYTKIKKNTIPKYMYYMLIIYPWDRIITKTALPSIVASDVLKTKWCLPSLNEQNCIVEYLDTQFLLINKLINKIKKQIEKLKEAKQSLISEAVTGKIEILD